MQPFAPKRLLGCILAAGCFWVTYIAAAGTISDLRELLWIQGAVEEEAEILDYEDKYVAAGDGQVRVTTFSYRYSFAGTEYNTTTRHLGPFVSKREADRIIRAAKHGERVACYINPKHPAEAVLSKNVNWGRCLMAVAFATGFFAAGVCLLVGCFSNRYAHQR